ncbi:hypothetical protein HNR77_001660 [Paenibacillus sp. JGP012]|uniref:hypothetical protein n=1 Tax=Paenibacillus sp. JGP012 TaxID=2735914 RepID=UPI001616B0FF|nr:hypothetical protein [Paenibacillus sp. JGP012]MBB6020599.1 hypothetical protein [Paenibacillus sp. JGP012]
MNRKMKFLMTATLATVTILSVSPLLALNEAQAARSTNPNLDIVTPYAIDNENSIANAPISGTSFNKKFNIKANYGWVKVWVENTSTETLTVRVTQSTLTGTEKMLFTVAPGKFETRYAEKPWATGDHYVSISTKNGGTMSGLLSVKMATTKDEL